MQHSGVYKGEAEEMKGTSRTDELDRFGRGGGRGRLGGTIGDAGVLELGRTSRDTGDLELDRISRDTRDLDLFSLLNPHIIPQKPCTAHPQQREYGWGSNPFPRTPR